MDKASRYTFTNGLRDGLPIGMGYLSVAFGFGIMAKNAGLTVWQSVLISMTNLTSAGQVAGVSVIAAAGTLLEMVLTQLIINLRYALMGLTLTQKLDGSFTLPVRMLTGFALTDEIFGVASVKPGVIGARYFAGLMVAPYIGWTSGTLLGAVAGQILPASVTAALGIAIYGMFVAILVPPVKKQFGVALTVTLAAGISLLLRYVPLFSFVTEGFAVIICAVVAAAIAAAVKPLPDEEATE